MKAARGPLPPEAAATAAAAPGRGAAAPAAVPFMAAADRISTWPATGFARAEGRWPVGSEQTARCQESIHRTRTRAQAKRRNGRPPGPSVANERRRSACHAAERAVGWRVTPTSPSARRPKPPGRAVTVLTERAGGAILRVPRPLGRRAPRALGVPRQAAARLLSQQQPPPGGPCGRLTGGGGLTSCRSNRSRSSRGCTCALRAPRAGRPGRLAPQALLRRSEARAPATRPAPPPAPPRGAPGGTAAEGHEIREYAAPEEAALRRGGAVGAGRAARAAAARRGRRSVRAATGGGGRARARAPPRLRLTVHPPLAPRMVICCSILRPRAHNGSEAPAAREGEGGGMGGLPGGARSGARAGSRASGQAPRAPGAAWTAGDRTSSTRVTAASARQAAIMGRGPRGKEPDGVPRCKHASG